MQPIKVTKVSNQHHGPLKLRELPWSPREGKSRAKDKWGTLREWPWEKANSGPKSTFLIHLSWELIKSSLFNIWVFWAQQKVPGSRIPRILPHLSLWTELACCKYCFNITSWHFILVLSLMPSAEQALSNICWLHQQNYFIFKKHWQNLQHESSLSWELCLVIFRISLQKCRKRGRKIREGGKGRRRRVEEREKIIELIFRHLNN